MKLRKPRAGCRVLPQSEEEGKNGACEPQIPTHEGRSGGERITAWWRVVEEKIKRVERGKAGKGGEARLEELQKPGRRRRRPGHHQGCALPPYPLSHSAGLAK